MLSQTQPAAQCNSAVTGGEGGEEGKGRKMLDSKTGRWKQQTRASSRQSRPDTAAMCSGVVKLTLSWHYINIVRHRHTHIHVCACLCMHEYLYPHLYAKLILKVNAAKLFAIRFHLALALSVASTFRLLTSSLTLSLSLSLSSSACSFSFGV